MKYLQRFFALIIISAAVFSCQKEYSIENTAGTASATAQWQFTEGGILFKGPIDTAAIDTISNIKFLTINGHSTDGSSQITLQVFGADLKAGTYKTPYSLFAYAKTGSIIYQTDQTAADSFTIVITKIDTVSVTGTFRGRALSGTAAKSIVDGKFTALFKKTATVTTPSTDSGQVVLWSKAGCGGGTSTSPISVSVNGKAGQVTKFFTTEPTTCDPAGAFSIKLPVGTYPWVAKCGTDSITGSVTVTKGGCTKQLVDFTTPVGDYFPLTANSNWTYLHTNSTPDDTLHVTSSGILKTYAGNPYNMFINDYGVAGFDSSFYRKSGNSYVEYYTADYNAFGLDSPGVAVEHIFLKDNVAAGTTWTSSYNGKFNGVPVTAQIKDTLVNNLSTYTVGANAFPNVLEMHSGYFSVFPAPIGSQELYVIKQWFAKGVGLIRYSEFNLVTGTEYTINITHYKVY